MSTVTVVGEALVDVVVGRDGSRTEHPGGSPANVALALGRLGHEVHLLTRLGRDGRGTRVAEHLAASHVRVLPGSFGDSPTTTAVATIGPDGAATYEFDLNCDLPVPVPGPAPGSACVHTGSFAAVLGANAPTVLDLVRAARTSATVSYDPNIRPGVLGAAEQVRPAVEALVEQADVVKLSDEDAHWLAPGLPPLELARRWQQRGPALVVVTRGADGAVAATGAGTVEVASRVTAVADTVGAGDSFSAALVHALDAMDLLGAGRRQALRALDLPATHDVLTLAAQVAAITVSRPGADPPWRHELEAALGG
jgi:fructokinase